MGAEILQEAEPGDMLPSLFGSKWKWSQPRLHKGPTVPQLALGAAWTSNNHGSSLESFLQQRLCLVSAFWRTPSIGLLTGIGDSSKPSVHPVHIHDRCPIAALASYFAHLGLSHWCPGCLIQAGVVSSTSHNQVTPLP